MLRRLRYVCERVRQNNGVIEVLFTRRENVGGSQEEHVLINIMRTEKTFIVGAPYWITIESAFPYDSG